MCAMKQMWFKIYLLFSLLICCSLLFAQQESNPSFSRLYISSVQLTRITQNQTTTSRIFLSDKPLQLFIFLSPECPMSKNYTLTLNKLFQQYNKQVEFYGCISGKGFTTSEIQSFISTYKTAFPLFVDADKKITNYFKASVTPEVLLLNNKGALVYSGAIDNWLEDTGKQRVDVTKRYLMDAIAASLSNKTVAVKKTKAYGCLINDY